MTGHRTICACAALLMALSLPAPRALSGSESTYEHPPRPLQEDVSASAEADLSGPVEERVVRVGAREFRAFCTSHRPRVILLHGASAAAESWLPVLERLEGEVGACAYDRAGMGAGRSEVPARGWYEMMDELRQIHRALGATSGYVLVGEGLGGLYARLFASGRPGDVGGLLLLDPVHEQLPERVRPGMPAEVWTEWMQARLRPNMDGLVEARLADRARDSRLPSIPVTVMTATRRRDGDGWDARFLGEAARQLHASILRGVSPGRHLPAEGAGPVIQEDRPDLVARELQRLVELLSARPRGR